MTRKHDHTIKHQDRERAQQWRQGVIQRFTGYFWLVFKNVVGWLLIISSPPIGMISPGPFGIVGFIIGFALVTFPGKRRLTSRVMRGRGLPIEMEVFTFVTAFFSIVITCILMYLLVDYVFELLSLDPNREENAYTVALVGLIIAGLFGLAVTWLVMRVGLKVVNYALKGTPYLRRKLRPWLRRRGLNILPTRRKRGTGLETAPPAMNEEILEIHERHQQRMRIAANAVLLWGKRALALAITIGIFYWIFRPIVNQWDKVRDRVMEMSPLSFIVASGMFAIFLFAFRAMVWRSILAAFGHKLPVAPTVRIWSTSELARYLPGAIWQVVGRALLARPYGVTSAVCSVTQVLELAIFLVANLIVAAACLGYFGFKHLEGDAWWWLLISAILLPVLLALLHTRIFYGIANYILERAGKPRIVQRVRGKALPLLLMWNIFGLMFQAVALYVLMAEPLKLQPQWIWTLAGAYSLAWCVGFLAFWAPGGIGVREVVFIGVMQLIAPQVVKNEAEFDVLLAFISVVTRLWATCGELMLAAIAYGLDIRGALGRDDAPGRLPGGSFSSEPTPSLAAPLGGAADRQV